MSQKKLIMSDFRLLKRKKMSFVLFESRDGSKIFAYNFYNEMNCHRLVTGYYNNCTMSIDKKTILIYKKWIEAKIRNKLDK